MADDAPVSASTPAAPRDRDGRTPRSSRRLPPEQRRRAALQEVAYLAALLLTAGALYSALVLLPSKLKTRELRTRRDALAAEVGDLRGSIAALERDARALREDPWSIERALRRRLGFLRPGERVFRPS
ncbi:MAG: septum formation initiator family protein [Planctomycetes bacterium]|nr:septum formation initiator family protein [Planctomycetota bacterium]